MRYYYSPYGYSTSNGTFVAISIAIAVIATVLALIFIVPSKRVSKMNKFTYSLHNICNFTTLLIDKIFKACYILSTVFVIIFGFLSLFRRGMFLYGFFLMILGPIAVRIIYELLMMLILCVQNISAIRKKYCDDEERKEKNAADSTANAQSAAYAQAPAPSYVYCSQCGNQYDANSHAACPYCGAPRY